MKNVGHVAVGHVAFLIGAAIAILTGFVSNWQSQATLLLVILGLVVGFLNVKGKETQEFLIAAIALMLAGSAGVDKIDLMGIGLVLKNVLENVAVFVAPAALVVGLKAVWALAND